MTRIHSAMAAALMVFCGATIAAAQQSQPLPQQQVGGHAKAQHGRHNADARLFKGVQLSTTERANLKSVRQKYAAQRKALHTSNTVDKSQTMALRQSERNDLRGALGSANQAKFDANVSAMRRRAAKRGTPVKP